MRSIIRTTPTGSTPMAVSPDSITAEGEIKESGGKGQATEMHAASITVHGWSDAETYPLQKKRHSFEKLREWAHLRPRTNTFGAVARALCESLSAWSERATRLRFGRGPAPSGGEVLPLLRPDPDHEAGGTSAWLEPA